MSEKKNLIFKKNEEQHHENPHLKILKRCVTFPWISNKGYDPPLLVLTFTNDPPLWGSSPPPPQPQEKNVPSFKKIQTTKYKKMRES